MDIGDDSMSEAKESLKKLIMMNQRINNKVETIMRLKSLAEKSTSSPITDMPRGTTKTDRADIMLKALMLEEEINQSINLLIDLKADAIRRIESMDNDVHKMILTNRYILGKTWEQIAVDMHYTFQHIHRLHGHALQEYQERRSGDDRKNKGHH